MTAGEICAVLEKLPPCTTVAVCLDGELTVSDACGDRVSGSFEGLFEIGEIREMQFLTLGAGWKPMVGLCATQEM